MTAAPGAALRTGPQPARPWGSQPGRLGVAIVVAGAAIGAGATILTGSDPGLLLGLFVVAATIIAATIVATRAAYLIIPVPALAYPVAALLAGYVHDRATVDTSLTGLAVSAIQWIASGFLAMVAATVIAIVIAAGRWMFTGPGARRAYREPRRRTGPPAPPRGGRSGAARR